MLENIIIIIAGFVVGIPILMNTIGPIIIWKTQKLPAIVQFDPVNNEIFIKERNSEFIKYDESIKQLGFEVLGSSVLRDNQTDTFFRLYWNPEIRVAVTVVTIKNNAHDLTYIEFTQKFNDGSMLDVSNSPRPEGYPKIDFKHAFRFPEITEPSHLLKAHLKLQKNIFKDMAPVAFEVERGFGEVEDFIRRESEALLEKGIVKRDIDPEGNRSLTLYGALLLTCTSVPPGVNIWGFITERQAKKALGNV